MVLIDHNNEMTIPWVKETGCKAGFSIYPDTKMSPERMVEIFKKFGTDDMIINSAADWGIGVLTCTKDGSTHEEKWHG